MGELSKIGAGIGSLITGILGLAIVAVILSNGANTVNVITSFFNGLTSLLKVTLAPVSGGSNTALSSLTGSSIVSTSNGSVNPLSLLNGVVSGLNSTTSSGLTSLTDTPTASNSESLAPSTYNF